MRRTALACLGFSTLALVPVLLGGTQIGCNNPQSEHVIRAAQPIQGGTVDQGDSNVVGILIGDGTGNVGSACSGSLIGPNLVLTAHHCVANPPSNLVCGGKFSTTITAASQFMVTTNYIAAYNIWTGSGKMPTADGVTWWGVSTVSVPSTNNVCAGDQAALTLSSSVSGVCPLIPAVDVQPTDGETYTAIGFGITNPNGTTAGERYKVTGMTVECVGSADCQDNTIAATGEWTGGATTAKGTCEGDSGGPALDSSNRIIGTVSRGPGGACNSTVYESTYDSGGTTNGAWIKTVATAAAQKGGYAVAGWVTGGATSNPANGYACSGTSSSSSSGTTSSSSSSSSTSGTTSGGAPTTCSQADNGIGCCVGNVNYYCTSQGTVASQNCATSGGTCGWDASGNNGSGWYDCTGSGTDPSGTYPLACGGAASSSSGTTSSSSTSSSGTTSSSSSSSGGTTSCAGQTVTGNATCDACIDGTASCCTAFTNCVNDAPASGDSCGTCASSSSPPADCASNAAYNAWVACVTGPCASACGNGSGSSSSSGGTTSSSSGSTGTGGRATGGSGTGAGTTSSSGSVFGNGGSSTGTGTGGVSFGTGGGGVAGSHGVGNTSSCSVSSTGSAPASPASLAGLLLGAALVVSRRRR